MKRCGDFFRWNEIATSVLVEIEGNPEELGVNCKLS